MKPRLFLTGPIGCGKSTAIAAALGDRISRCGGFLTRRQRGDILTFALESPDGSVSEHFLTFSEGKPRLDLTVFSKTGIPLLTGAVLILDEIGGAELLNPEFSAALEMLLAGDRPIIGVVKGQGPASKLIEALGLSEEYARAADALRQRLGKDQNTLLYECGRFDENARRLAAQWAEEYLHE